MALFRLEAKIFSRAKCRRSVIAAAAYRAGTKLRDELREKTFDYARRARGVLQSAIFAPENAPAWAHDSTQLWNTVERSEKRVDAQLAREFVLAVPPELSPDEQFQTAVGWAKKELVTNGMVAEISLHHPASGTNPHVHILCTMRKLEGDNFSAKKPREWNEKSLLCHQRESWAEAVNSALAQAGRPERVDHRTLKAQGIDREPQPKIGVAATAMQRKGVEPDPKRFKVVRQVKNEAIPSASMESPLELGIINHTAQEKQSPIVSRQTVNRSFPLAFVCIVRSEAAIFDSPAADDSPSPRGGGVPLLDASDRIVPEPWIFGFEVSLDFGL